MNCKLVFYSDAGWDAIHVPTILPYGDQVYQVSILMKLVGTLRNTFRQTPFIAAVCSTDSSLRTESVCCPLYLDHMQLAMGWYERKQAAITYMSTSTTVQDIIVVPDHVN
jgi:hypothetical protein